MNNRRVGPVRPGVVVVNGLHQNRTSHRSVLTRSLLLSLLVLTVLYLCVTTKTFLQLPDAGKHDVLLRLRPTTAAGKEHVAVVAAARRMLPEVVNGHGEEAEAGVIQKPAITTGNNKNNKKINPPPSSHNNLQHYDVLFPKENENVSLDNNKEGRKKFLDGLGFPYLVRSHDINDLTAFEIIPHPGHLYSKTPRVFPLPVPLFWEPPNGGRESLLKHDGAMTLEEAKSVGSWTTLPDGTEMETIYVSIASYRDFQCPTTIESLYGRAKYPDRIRVAVVDQLGKGDVPCIKPQKDCQTRPDQALCQYQHLIDTYQMDAKLAVGPVFARHIGHRLYRGEYFALQIDAHVTFVQDWDHDIQQQWRSARNEMAVVTVYLSDVQNSINEQDGTLVLKERPIMCNTEFSDPKDKYSYLHHTQQPQGRPGIHNQPTLEPYWAAGFCFARGHWVVRVPYDQHLPMVFQGEEISMGVRGFTHGYDYYAPERSVCFHTYAMGKNIRLRKQVKLFWENNRYYRGCDRKSFLRLVALTNMNTEPLNSNNNNNDQYSRVDETLYGLGRVRTVDKFLKTFGIHLEERRVEKHLCGFVGKKMMAVFMPFLRKNTMGIDYDRLTFEFRDPNPDRPEMFAYMDKKKKK